MFLLAILFNLRATKSMTLLLDISSVLKIGLVQLVGLSIGDFFDLIRSLKPDGARNEP